MPTPEALRPHAPTIKTASTRWREPLALTPIINPASKDALELGRLWALATPIPLLMGTVFELTYLLALNVQVDILPLTIGDLVKASLNKLWVFLSLTLTAVLAEQARRKGGGLPWLLLGLSTITFPLAFLSLADHLGPIFQLFTVVPTLLALALLTNHWNDVATTNSRSVTIRNGRQLAAGTVAFLLACVVYVALQEAWSARSTEHPNCTAFDVAGEERACILRSYQAGVLLSEQGKIRFRFHDGERMIWFE